MSKFKTWIISEMQFCSINIKHLQNRTSVRGMTFKKQSSRSVNDKFRQNYPNVLVVIRIILLMESVIQSINAKGG
jgi:hypothetical protein